MFDLREILDCKHFKIFQKIRNSKIELDKNTITFETFKIQNFQANIQNFKAYLVVFFNKSISFFRARSF